MADSPNKESHYDKNRIMKNTMILYIRMFLSMGVSLYTSRVVLNVLGVEDYGIYNVVGGVVSMFTFLNAMMTTATQRYLNVEMGRRNYKRLRLVFNMSLLVHLAIALLIFILGETIGLWFVNTQMTIPPSRMDAANWVYQLSVITCVLSMTMPPFMATIIAHERMNIYGYFSIIEVSLKLVIVFMLMFISFDKLILYAILTFAVSTLMLILYRVYCYRHFTETHLMLPRDKSLFKEMLGFSGWNLFGNLAAVLMNQGQNILLNVFFGPIANTARGIAFNVNIAVTQFTGNFMISANPQITKTFAADEKEKCFDLVTKSAKFSFIILFVLIAPILLQTYPILLLWLNEVPEYSILFCQLTLINALIMCVSSPLMTLAAATGKIKLYQFSIGSILMLNLPLSYVLLKYGATPQSVFYVTISLSILGTCMRLYLVRRISGLSIKSFIRSVIIPCYAVGSIFVLVIYYILNYLPGREYSYFYLIPAIFVFAMITMYAFVLTSSERSFVFRMIYNKLLKKT